jgi:hypothetical protein
MVSLVLPLSYYNGEKDLPGRHIAKRSNSASQASSKLHRPKSNAKFDDRNTSVSNGNSNNNRKKKNGLKVHSKDTAKSKCLQSLGSLLDEEENEIGMETEVETQNTKVISQELHVPKERRPSTAPTSRTDIDIHGMIQTNDSSSKSCKDNSGGDCETLEIQHLISELRSILTSDESNVPQGQSPVELVSCSFSGQ